jgi:hypothetical protein
VVVLTELLGYISNCRFEQERAMATKGKGKRQKKLGSWKVRRVGENQLMVTLPPGMKMTSKGPIKIEDVLSGIANYMSAKKDPTMSCCSVNLMVA